MEKNNRYISALGLNRLTPLYDPLLRWVMREAKFREAGFDPVEETVRYTTIFGTLALYQARRPR